MAQGPKAMTAGRNDPCPCGSGRKFKKCCMGKAAPVAPAPVGGGPEGGGPAEEPLRAVLERARGQHAAGHLDAAAGGYRAILERKPRHADALFGLGQIQGRMGNIDEAVDLVRRAIAAGARDAPHLAQLAALLVETGDADGTRDAVQRAVALRPRDPLIRSTAAECMERVGRLDEALRHARAAVDAAADDPHANAVLGSLLRRGGDLVAARRHLDRALGSPRITVAVRARALNQLGQVLDRQGLHDLAMASFVEHGRIMRDDPVAARLDPSFWPKRIAGYAEVLDELPWSRWRQWADRETHERPDPIFLVGFPRSGTTLTEQILAAHPGVVASDERPLVPALRRDLLEMLGPADDVAELLPSLTLEHAAALRDAYWARARAVVGEELPQRFIDKLPLNIVDLPMLNAVFPRSRVIVALRDPRDVCVSCFMQSFRLNQAMIHFTSLEGTVALYERVMGLWLAMRPHVTLPVLVVRYEETVADVESQARRVLDFMELEWDPAVLHFHERAGDRVISTPSAAAVTEPVHRRAVARWRSYEQHLAPLLPRLQRFVDAFG